MLSTTTINKAHQCANKSIEHATITSQVPFLGLLDKEVCTSIIKTTEVYLNKGEMLEFQT